MIYNVVITNSDSMYITQRIWHLAWWKAYRLRAAGL